MQANNRRRQAISVLRNKLIAIQGIEEIRDDLLNQMTMDWILNADPNEPGFDNPLQMKGLVEGDYPGVQLDNQQAQALLDAWMTFVSEYYAINGGKRKKTRKHKKRGKKTRKH